MGELLSAVILGVIEGLTEFLPVSSTGHMILTAHLLNFEGERAKTFEIVVQLGAVLSVLVLYWSKFMKMFSQLRSPTRAHHQLNLLHIILAMLPAVLVGLLLHHPIKTYLFTPLTVMMSLVVGGILMIYAETRDTKITSPELDDVTYRQAFGIGLFQCLALWPGFSRSGSTISGGLLLGVSQKAAAEFTFLVSVPIMLAATGLDLVKSSDNLSAGDLPLFLIGLMASFVVAMLAVVTFLNLIKRLKLRWFAYYRFVLAAIFFFILYA